MASSSTNQTLLVAGVLGIAGFAVYWFLKHHKSGSGSGTTMSGPVGGGDYYPQGSQYPSMGQGQPLPAVNFGPGGGTSSGGFGGSQSMQTLADFVAAGNKDFQDNGAPLALAQTDAGMFAGTDHLSEQPETLPDSGSAFMNWWNSWAGNPVSSDLPTGSIGDASSAEYVGSSDAVQVQDDSGGSYDGEGGTDVSEYDGGDGGGYDGGGGGNYDGGGTDGAGDSGSVDGGGEDDSGD